jgi:hypothetical protein
MAFRTLLVAYVTRIDQPGHLEWAYLVMNELGSSCSLGLGRSL